MPINVETPSIAELENMVANHRRQRATHAPLFLEAIEELEKRKGKGLEFNASLSITRRAAEEGRYISYKELADAGGVEWSQAHYAMNDHLWRLVEYSHLKHGVLFSAIVVNKPNVKAGEMEAKTLKDFIGAARELGYTITDEQTFLKAQQSRVFEWAGREAPPSTAQ